MQMDVTGSFVLITSRTSDTDVGEICAVPSRTTFSDEDEDNCSDCGCGSRCREDEDEEEDEDEDGP